MFNTSNLMVKSIRVFFVCAIVFNIAACTAPTPKGFVDPYEEQNRAVHAANRDLDKDLVKPLAGAYGNGVPGPIRQGVGNFASNLNLPSVVMNDILQLRILRAFSNTTRFAINTTVGLGGILDPAGAMGLHEDPTDFGETLHIWGVPEGNYVELPFLGPSTERDMIGMVVDVFTNPLTFKAPSPEKYLGPVVKGLSKLDSRYRFADTIDSILYESADSYAQARLFYLQSRRFKLGQTADQGDDNDDPYADPYE